MILEIGNLVKFKDKLFVLNRINNDFIELKRDNILTIIAKKEFILLAEEPYKKSINKEIKKDIKEHITKDQYNRLHRYLDIELINPEIVKQESDYLVTFEFLSRRVEFFFGINGNVKAEGFSKDTCCFKFDDLSRVDEVFIWLIGGDRLV